MQVKELTDFNLAVAKVDRQTAKFNSCQIFWLYGNIHMYYFICMIIYVFQYWSWSVDVYSVFTCLCVCACYSSASLNKQRRPLNYKAHCDVMYVRTYIFIKGLHYMQVCVQQKITFHNNYDLFQLWVWSFKIQYANYAEIHCYPFQALYVIITLYVHVQYYHVMQLLVALHHFYRASIGWRYMVVNSHCFELFLPAYLTHTGGPRINMFAGMPQICRHISQSKWQRPTTATRKPGIQLSNRTS